VLEKLEGKSSRECEQELLKLSSVPLELAKPEKRRQLDDTHSELKLVVDADFLEKLDRIQALRSHASPSMGYAELLEFMADEVLKRLDPIEKEKAKKTTKPERLDTTSPPASEVKQVPPSTPNKHLRVPIPASVKRHVWLRDHGKCGFIHAETGKTCDSSYFLELDHIHPVALGGDNDPENLRLRCRAHNQRNSVKVFGPR
jgi:hypothetical protein